MPQSPITRIGGRLCRPYDCPLFDLVLFTQKTVDFFVRGFTRSSCPSARRPSVFDKAVDQQVLKLHNPGSLFWTKRPSVLIHLSHPSEPCLLFHSEMHGRNHQLLSWSCVVNCLLRAAVGAAAARASRSKLSESSKTAFPCAGIGQLPSYLPRLLGAIEPIQGFIQN